MYEGKDPGSCYAPDEKVVNTIRMLKDLIKERLLSLSHNEWELLCAEYFEFHGAKIDRSKKIGGSEPIIEFEANFHGKFIESKNWRVQVKDYKYQVDKPEIENYYRNIGNEGNLCLLSVRGFTDKAKEFAEESNIKLLEADDFVFFVLTNKIGNKLSKKLKIPPLDIV